MGIKATLRGMACSVEYQQTWPLNAKEACQGVKISGGSRQIFANFGLNFIIRLFQSNKMLNIAKLREDYRFSASLNRIYVNVALDESFLSLNLLNPTFATDTIWTALPLQSCLCENKTGQLRTACSHEKEFAGFEFKTSVAS